MPLRHRFGDQFDLARVEAEALVSRPRLRLDRAIVRQEYPLRTAFDDSGRDGAVGDIGERLRGEDDSDILLAECLQPFADAGKQQVVEIDQASSRMRSVGAPVKRSSRRWKI